MVSKLSKFAGLVSLLFCAAASPQAAPDTSVTASITSLAARAGSVFAGQVTAVRHLGGVVEVEFRIDQTVKGPATVSTVLREWAGLWAAGQRRYWVGERAVVFLHEAGKSGLSSSVDGMEGVLPMSSSSVDVQRLETRVLRSTGAPMVDAHISLAQLTRTVQGPPAIGPSPTPIAPPVYEPIPRPITLPIRRPIRSPIVELPVNSAPALAPILVMPPDTADDFDLNPNDKSDRTVAKPKAVAPLKSSDQESPNAIR